MVKQHQHTRLYMPTWLVCFMQDYDPELAKAIALSMAEFQQHHSGAENYAGDAGMDAQGTSTDGINNAAVKGPISTRGSPGDASGDDVIVMGEEGDEGVEAAGPRTFKVCTLLLLC